MDVQSPGASARFIYKTLMNVRPAILSVFLKKLLKIKRFVIEAKFGKFFIDPASLFGQFLLQRGEYEPSMTEVLRHFLKPSAVFLDVGANEGYFSVIASKIVGSSGRVIAVEPQQRVGNVIQKNLEINGINNTILVADAISDVRGSASLYISPDTNTGSTGLVNSTRYSLPTQTIRTITLTDLLEKNSIRNADLMKMDIEGYEYEAIIGSPDVFKEKRIKAIALEVHPKLLSQRGLKPDDIYNFLKSCGYVQDSIFSDMVFVAQSEFQKDKDKNK